MCLSIKETQRRDKFGIPIPTIARKDITCYKWLERKGGKLYSPYFSRSKRLRISQNMKADLQIFQGYVNEGIHAYVSKKSALTNDNLRDVIVECIIPKGAQYIKGKWDEIVTTKMKLTRIIAEGGKLKK